MLHKIVVNGKATLTNDLSDALKLAKAASDTVDSIVYVQYKSMIDGTYRTQARYIHGRMI